MMAGTEKPMGCDWANSWSLPEISAIDTVSGFYPPRNLPQAQPTSSTPQIVAPVMMECFQPEMASAAGVEKNKRRPSWPLESANQAPGDAVAMRRVSVATLPSDPKIDARSRNHLNLRLDASAMDNTQVSEAASNIMPTLASQAATNGYFSSGSTDSLNSSVPSAASVNSQQSAGLPQSSYLPTTRRYTFPVSQVEPSLPDYSLAKDRNCSLPNCLVDKNAQFRGEDLAIRMNPMQMNQVPMEEWSMANNVATNSNKSTLQTFSCLTPPSDNSPERPAMADMPVSQLEGTTTLSNMSRQLFPAQPPAYNSPSQSYFVDHQQGFATQNQFGLMPAGKSFPCDPGPINPHMPALGEMSTINEQVDMPSGQYANDFCCNNQQAPGPVYPQAAPQMQQSAFCAPVSQPEPPMAQQPQWLTPFSKPRFVPPIPTGTASVFFDSPPDEDLVYMKNMNCHVSSQNLIASELEKALGSFHSNTFSPRKSSITYVEADITADDLQAMRRARCGLKPINRLGQNSTPCPPGM